MAMIRRLMREAYNRPDLEHVIRVVVSSMWTKLLILKRKKAFNNCENYINTTFVVFAYHMCVLGQKQLAIHTQ